MLRIGRRNVGGPGSEEVAFDEIMIGYKYLVNSLKVPRSYCKPPNKNYIDSQTRQGNQHSAKICNVL